MKAFVLVAASLAAATLLGGCASSKKPAEQGEYVYLLDRHSQWVEDKVDTLPPLPADRNLVAFDVSQTTPLDFSIDAPSLTIGNDGVVRYTVVVTSPAGARNINYEGIRCATSTWRQYASLNENHDGWDTTVASDWRPISGGGPSAYQSALYQDYFCQNRMPAGKPRAILDNLRRHRTLLDQLVH